VISNQPKQLLVQNETSLLDDEFNTVPGYSPRTVTNRNTPSFIKQPQHSTPALNRKARREYAKLRLGMQGQECYLLTLTKGRGIDLRLRSDEWKVIRTRLGQRYPNFEAFTIYEFSPLRGVHLHVVIKGVPNLDVDWLKHVVSLQANGTQIHVVPIGRADQDKTLDEHGISHYLTKQIADEKKMAGWPKGFRVTSSTRNFCPGWMSRRAWGEHQRSLKPQTHHA
jgi:hypothetical protein